MCDLFFYCSVLVSVAFLYILENALSAIYTFFDPGADRRSLGVYAILWEIEQVRSRGLEYLYLGYWIRDCQKMAYKSDYRPLQIYTNSSWTTLT